ncbi:MAG: hypothetical protein GEV11_20440 [Streptosporangiales bacterium]|nr:hypothetical protein [Streptosporangiales bacterium]
MNGIDRPTCCGGNAMDCCADRVEVAGPENTITVGRDPNGVPHVHARGETDAWFGLGWAAARDRLWQMEYDRRRGHGRWAEVVGAGALEADRLARRMRLADAGRADVAAMDAGTAATFGAYADGVNAFAATGDLPPEYAAAGIAWEPWTPADSAIGFKVRHLVMGIWQYKVARAALLGRCGPEAFTVLDPRPLPGMRVTVPPEGRLAEEDGRTLELTERARAEVEAAAPYLGFLSEVEAGSNAWVIGPGRSATGKPLMANDSHRALDVPNVYWQAHLTCDAFTVTGGTFPGIPGFPHFGTNGRVGWAITNASGDAQDLYVESFRTSGDWTEVRTATGWEPVEPRDEVIRVRDAEPYTERCWVSPNGPIVHGDPLAGSGLALRWTATDRPCLQYAVLGRMVRAGGVTELLDAQDGWVDPMNNLVVADVDGHIGYLLRGELPQRESLTGTYLPVPGWLPEHRWTGRVPFAEMPRVEDPEEQIIVTSNNTITADEKPFINHSVNDMHRVERIHELAAGGGHTRDDLEAWQGDTVSVGARAWARLLARRGPYEGAAERARQVIADGDGDLGPDGAAGLVYACFRRVAGRRLLIEAVGEEAAAWLLTSPLPGCAVLARRWFSVMTWPPRPGAALPADAVADGLLAEILAAAWADAEHAAGGDPAKARWGDHLRTAARHTLSPVVGDVFDPPSVYVGGDAETVQNAAYGWDERGPFEITNLSVYRQVLDLAELGGSRWIVPGGVSGRPGDPHYADQLGDWAAHRLRPMYPWSDADG